MGHRRPATVHPNRSSMRNPRWRPLKLSPPRRLRQPLPIHHRHRPPPFPPELPLSNPQNPNPLHGLALAPDPDHFTKLLPNIAASIASQFFLRGFNRCCNRTSSSSSVETLVRFYAAILKNSDAVPCELEIDDGENGKVGGRITPSDLLMLLWVCWIMARCSRISKLPKSGGEDDEMVVLPDLSHLVLSVFVWCGALYKWSSTSESSIFNFGYQIWISFFSFIIYQEKILLRVLYVWNLDCSTSYICAIIFRKRN